MADKIFVSNQRLAYYDTKLKAWVTAADAQVLTDAKAYADGLAVNYEAAGSVKTAQDALQANIDAEKQRAEGVEAGLAERITAAEGDIGTIENLNTSAKDNLVNAINEVRNSVSAGGTAAALSIDTSVTTDGALKSYTLYQGENKVGVIDIPKDMVVESGEVVVNPEGQAEGTYIKLVLANVANPLYINVGTLVDIYKAKANASQVQITVDSTTREISAAIVAGSIGTDELADGSVTTAKIVDANVTKAKLSTTLQASIDKADAAAPQTALDAEVTRATEAEAKALTDAKAYTDAEIAKEVTARDAAIATAKSEAIADAEGKDATVLSQAKAYTDEKIGDVDLSGIATNAAAIEALQQTHATDKAALEGSIKTNSDAIEAIEADYLKAADKTELQGNIDALEASFVEITEAQIDEMFA